LRTSPLLFLSLRLPLLYDDVCVSIYMCLQAYAPPHSGSRVTGELEETSAVVDRSLVLLPAALRCVSLFASYKKANGELSWTIQSR